MDSPKYLVASGGAGPYDNTHTTSSTTGLPHPPWIGSGTNTDTTTTPYSKPGIGENNGDPGFYTSSTTTTSHAAATTGYIGSSEGYVHHKPITNGQIAGIAVGSALALAAITGLVVYLIMRRRRPRYVGSPLQKQPQEDGNPLVPIPSQSQNRGLNANPNANATPDPSPNQSQNQIPNLNPNLSQGQDAGAQHDPTHAEADTPAMAAKVARTPSGRLPNEEEPPTYEESQLNNPGQRNSIVAAMNTVSDGFRRY